MFRQTIFSGFLLAAACGQNPPADLEKAASEVADATEVNARVSEVSLLFVGSTMAACVTRIRAEWPVCVTIDTDDATYANVTFDRCPGRLRHPPLDGTLSATRVETDGATSYALSTDGLSVGRTLLTGAWNLTLTGEPLESGSYSGELHVVGPRGNSLDTETSASFAREDDCLRMSFDMSWTVGDEEMHAAATRILRCP